MMTRIMVRTLMMDYYAGDDEDADDEDNADYAYG